MTGPGPRVKMSVLARMAGLPAATIKHYVNAGLLPQPERTSRNMAYYDASLVPRIRRIKELQRTHFLPLRVIRDVLEAEALPSRDETVAAAIASVLERTSTPDRRTRNELAAHGMPVEQLDWLKAAGLVSPRVEGGVETYAGDDLELLRVLGAARRAGISAEMLPVTILRDYLRALRELARVELALFREGVAKQAKTGEVGTLTEAATLLSERLVVLLRRKMLVPALRRLSEPPPAPARRRAKRPRAAPRRR